MPGIMTWVEFWFATELSRNLLEFEIHLLWHPEAIASSRMRLGNRFSIIRRYWIHCPTLKHSTTCPRDGEVEVLKKWENTWGSRICLRPPLVFPWIWHEYGSIWIVYTDPSTNHHHRALNFIRTFSKFTSTITTFQSAYHHQHSTKWPFSLNEF